MVNKLMRIVTNSEAVASCAGSISDRASARLSWPVRGDQRDVALAALPSSMRTKRTD